MCVSVTPCERSPVIAHIAGSKFTELDVTSKITATKRSTTAVCADGELVKEMKPFRLPYKPSCVH